MGLGEWILIIITGILIAVILFFCISTHFIKRDVEKLENSFEANEKLLEEIAEYNKLLDEYEAHGYYRRQAGFQTGIRADLFAYDKM